MTIKKKGDQRIVIGFRLKEQLNQGAGDRPDGKQKQQDGKVLFKIAVGAKQNHQTHARAGNQAS